MKFSMKHILQNESGSVTMIAALLILVMLTIIGLTAMDTTTVEMAVAANDQLSKIAFYNADAGVYGTPKIVSTIINTSDEVPVGPGTDAVGIQYLDTVNGQTDLFRQVMGYDPYDGGTRELDLGAAFNTTIDVERVRQQIIAGGGAEFASGA
jgi:hypothetical protein